MITVLLHNRPHARPLFRFGRPPSDPAGLMAELKLSEARDLTHIKRIITNFLICDLGLDSVDEASTISEGVVGRVLPAWPPASSPPNPIVATEDPCPLPEHRCPFPPSKPSSPMSSSPCPLRSSGEPTLSASNVAKKISHGRVQGALGRMLQQRETTGNGEELFFDHGASYFTGSQG